MSLVFNSGRGGAICDACRVMVIDGKRVLCPHVTEVDTDPTERMRHYCDPRCGSTDALLADAARGGRRS